LISLKAKNMEYNNENARRIEDLLESRSFHELTIEEREFVLRELGSEEVYASLRKISEALVAEKADLSPDPLILAKLHQQLKRTRQEQSLLREIITYKVPAYAVAPLILLMVTVMYLSFDRQPLIEKEPYVSKVDTVYVASPRDTVVIERVVVKYQSHPEKKVSDYAVVGNVSKDEESEGVSMKDKEELESFLVSGS
jgi:hypothetical protein